MGFSVDWARDGRDAEAIIREPGYAVILLDVNLRGLDGGSLLRAARASGVETPILILTARDDMRDRVAGLGLGADDYLGNRLRSANWWGASAPSSVGAAGTPLP